MELIKGIDDALARGISTTIEEYAPPQPARQPKASSRAPWPAPLLPEALHGLAGDVVRTIGPHTEADPAAILVQFLVAFGSIVGRGPHWYAEDDRHSLNLMAVIVGNTSAGRKGTSWKRVKQIFKDIDSSWAKRAGREGLQSGEGLVWAVRDIDCANSADVEGPDKRFLLVESEFATILKNSRREGSILSAVIRKAWDDGNLDLISKNSSVTATDAHISIIGHITQTELHRAMTETEEANGFANRFLWVCTKRSKLLPDGGTYSDAERDHLEERVRDAVAFARDVERMDFTKEAVETWRAQYAELSADHPGRLGRVVTRAAPQVRRLACIYALLGSSRRVGFEHLAAALAVWQYCLDSARHVFGDSTGDKVADKLLTALREAPAGLTKTELIKVFHGNRYKDEIDAALEQLLAMGLAYGEVEVHARGRPGERWFAGQAPAGSSSSSISSNS